MNSTMRFFMVLVFTLFISRAFFVTVVMHNYYSGLASGNRVKVLVLPAVRGVVLDRTGKIIAGNVAEGNNVIRHYPEGEVVASVIGYVSDGVGVAGLEKQYDSLLSGKPGERVVEETAVGKEVAEIKRSEPETGGELKLNLDLGLQKAAYRLLKGKLSEGGKSGAVVVSKTDGSILALVSLPTFDPNLFIVNGKRGAEGGVYSDTSAVINDNERQPLFNRAVSGAFVPGSVYKILTALIGLQERVVGENELISDSGEIVVGDYRYGNWYFDKYGKTEGSIDIIKALARSNDIYFYKLGERIGVDKFVNWSNKLGLGQKTGIDLPAEANGLMPSPLWMEKERGSRWFLGNTYHLAIGQGDLLATPLQMNMMTASAISGKKCRPRLAQADSVCSDLGLSETAREAVFSGMRQACSAGGTAFPFYDLKGFVVCKTGTAQHGGKEDKPHAWLTAVIPRTQELKNSRTQNLPELSDYEDGIVVTVMIESGGEGSEVAAPVARKVVDYILEK